MENIWEINRNLKIILCLSILILILNIFLFIINILHEIKSPELPTLSCPQPKIKECPKQLTPEEMTLYCINMVGNVETLREVTK